MTTSQEAYAVTQENLGSDLAAETAAAMAAASIAFRKMDPVYSNELLRHAREVGGDPPISATPFSSHICSYIWMFLHSST
jgi:hypothetical protein